MLVQINNPIPEIENAFLHKALSHVDDLLVADNARHLALLPNPWNVSGHIREIDFNDAVTIEKDGGVLYIFVEYESRINIYNNVDAVVTWDETTEIFL